MNLMHKNHFRGVVFASALLITGSVASAQQKTVNGEWLQFRGPNGSGVADASGLPAVFGPTKNVAWKTSVPFARSSPIVAGNRIFLTATEGEKLITIALDRKTGKVLWRRDAARSRHMPIYKANDGASPSPVSDGKNVYVFVAELGLIGYTEGGKERWRVPLGPFHSFYGLGGSPVLSGNTLVMVCDQRTNSFMVAVDTRNGKVLWKKDRANGEGYSTPIVYKPQSGPAQVIVLGSMTLDAYSVDNGERLWWVSQVGSYPKGVPVLDANMVYVSVAGADEPFLPPFDDSLKQYDKDKDGRIHQEEMKSQPEFYEHFGWLDANNDKYIDRGEYDVTRNSTVSGYGVTAIRLGGQGDLTSTNVLWRLKKTVPDIPAPLLYRGVLYGVKDGGIIISLDPNGGAVLKTDRSRDALGEYYSSPVAGDGKVFLISGGGKVTVLKAGAQWEILAVNDLGEDCWATPAIAGGNIYIRTHNYLYSFSESTK